MSVNLLTTLHKHSRTTANSFDEIFLENTFLFCYIIYFVKNPTIRHLLYLLAKDHPLLFAILKNRDASDSVCRCSIINRNTLVINRDTRIANIFLGMAYGI